MFQDKTKVCKDCNEDFTFTAGEQEFFSSRGFENEPGRCPSCRAAKKRNFDGGGRRSQGGNRGGEREMHAAVCHTCGTHTTVPFQPTAGKPVYCSDCFQPRRSY